MVKEGIGLDGWMHFTACPVDFSYFIHVVFYHRFRHFLSLFTETIELHLYTAVAVYRYTVTGKKHHTEAPTHYHAGTVYHRQICFDVTIGQHVVSDRALPCAILTRHKTLSDG